MAAFSSFCENSASLLNSSSTLNDIILSLLEEEEPNTDNFPLFYQPESATHQKLDHSTNVSALSNNDTFVFSVTNNNNITMDSSSIVTGYKYDDPSTCENTTQKVFPMEKKRKLKQGPSATSAHSKETRQVRKRKQEEMKDGEVKKATNDEELASSPRGYVHVRARRGQATNSHSLAERVRREKISKRMKLLQALVPGCDKLTGKALVLDEIINYVQSLQNQVEFLSMRIASASQMFNEFGMESDEYMTLNNLGSPFPTMQQLNNTRTANDYMLLDTSANSTMFHSSQIPNHLPLDNNRQVAWIEEEQRQML